MPSVIMTRTFQQHGIGIVFDKRHDFKFVLTLGRQLDRPTVDRAQAQETGGRGRTLAPPKKNFWQKYFSGKKSCRPKIMAFYYCFSGIYHVKFGNFVNFSGKYHVKFGHFVNFSCIYFRAEIMEQTSRTFENYPVNIQLQKQNQRLFDKAIKQYTNQIWQLFTCVLDLVLLLYGLSIFILMLIC